MSVIAPVRTVHLGSLHVDSDMECRTELDSHADTCVVGEETALVIHDYEQPVRVFGYDESIGQATNYKTVSAVIAYVHPETGETYMLTIHQAILIPQMKANLLSPMQLRDNDLRVNDEPKYMALNPSNDHHAIVIPGKGDDAKEITSTRSVILVSSTRRSTTCDGHGWLQGTNNGKISSESTRNGYAYQTD
jgi:hypothetical protein